MSASIPIRPATPGLAIDAAGTMVRDDAIWAERTVAGWRLSVSVPDVDVLVPRDDDTVLMGLERSEERRRLSFAAERDLPAVTMTLDVERGRGVVGFTVARTMVRAVEMEREAATTIMRDGGHPALTAALEAEPALRAWLFRGRHHGPITEAQKGAPARVLDGMLSAANLIATRFVRSNAERGLVFRAQGAQGEGSTKRWFADPRRHTQMGYAEYAQFTTPLNRAADLVNLRCLLAAWDGRPSPYNQAGLEEVAETMDSLAANSARIQRQREIKFAGHTDSVCLSDLSRPLFLGVIEAICHGEAPPQGFADETIRRAAAGMLAAEDFAPLLLHPVVVDALGTEARLWMATYFRGAESCPMRFKRLWSAATGTLGYAPGQPSFHPYQGPNGWIVSTSAPRIGRAEGVGSTKEEARVAALDALLAVAVGTPGVKVPAHAQPLHQPAAERLDARAVACGLGAPRFVCHRGTDGDMVAELSFAGSDLRFSSRAHSGKWAREAAAAAALSALPVPSEAPSPGPRP